MSDAAKPWAEPGLSLEERALRVEQGFPRIALTSTNRRIILEALRAAEQDGYVRGFNAAEDIFAPRKAG